MTVWPASLVQLAASVRSGAQSATRIAERALADIRQRDRHFHCFTRILAEEALRAAQAVDERVAAGHDPGPLAGVPFAVKDLYDVAGIPTTAGAKLRAGVPPALTDAVAVARLKAAGAVLIGTLNMDEFAYGFATVNAHFGVTHNPHDTGRLAGGSSGGSAAAVAAGMVPLTLGSDTNGSIRVPASLCGIWGMRPADGAISLDGVFPLAESLDTAGPFTRSAADLALVYEILSGGTGGPVATPPRIAGLGGWFTRNMGPEAAFALESVLSFLGGGQIVTLPGGEAARSAAFLITAAESGALHLPTLRRQPLDYDPAVRDRLLAGALLPAARLVQARQFRRLFRETIDRLFQSVDILIAPATPVVAPRIGDATMLMDGKPVSARANLGIYTQPLSLAGIPVVAAPFHRPGHLPIGLQFATAPGRESMLLGLLQQLENDGILQSSLLC